MISDPLERSRRAVSRIALYGSLALVALLGSLLLYLASEPLVEEQRLTWGDTDFAALEEVQLLREYVQIDTSEATGDVAAGVRFLAAELRSAGIEPHVEVLASGDANLWAIVEGEEPGAVVLHHHVDVKDVPDPGRWKHPPFAAEIDGPWLYGRGTFDMKSIAIAQLLAVRDLVRSGVKPKKSVVLLATSGEETGSELGTRWILREHPDLVDRFDLVLTEGGVVEGRDRGDLKYWGTEVAQKRYFQLTVCNSRRQPLDELDRYFHGTRTPTDRLYLVDEIRDFLPGYAATRDAARLRDLLSDPEALLRDRPAFETLPGYVQAMFRNEIHSLGVREVPGGGWELDLRVHLLPGIDLDDVRDELLPAWLFWGLETHFYAEPAADHGSPPDHPAMKLIKDLVSERHPDVPVGPVFLAWTATDARFFRQRGIPSYGFSPFLVFTTDALRVDGTSERISLPEYVAGVALYRDLLRRLVT